MLSLNQGVDFMNRLKRKIDDFLIEWKNDKDHLPLIIRGARQIGKTNAIEYFAKNNYKYVVEINFDLQKEYRTIFNNGYEVENIIHNISIINNNFEFVPNETLIFFDEIQDCQDVATSLKSFNLDRRFDVICSGSLLGINYNEIESNSVGNKEDYDMYSMDFEEFLWALGYKKEQIEDLYTCMKEVKPLSTSAYEIMSRNFLDYVILGGMPSIVSKFVENKNFTNILKMQKQIIRDYEEDITKYAIGLDKTRVLNAFRKVAVFLGNENKKFQISKIAKGARNREYYGVPDWLSDAGLVNISYCMDTCALPLKENYNPHNYRLYFADTGLLIGSLDDEAQDDLRKNKNFNTYKGAIFENIVGDMLVKEGYKLYFYRNEKGTIEMDFFVRDANSLIPIEVKANDNATISLNKLIDDKKYKDIKYGIKLCNKNIGFNGKFYTFPYFMAFFLKRFLNEKS